MSALGVIGFSPEEVKAIYQILASILLLVTPDTDSALKQLWRSCFTLTFLFREIYALKATARALTLGVLKLSATSQS